MEENLKTCVVCRDTQDTSFYPTTQTLTTASNVTLAEKLSDLFISNPHFDFENHFACQICFDLLEQLDVFELNVINTKENLKQRYNSHLKEAMKKPSSTIETENHESAAEIKVECKLEEWPIEVDKEELEEEDPNWKLKSGKKRASNRIRRIRNTTTNQKRTQKSYSEYDKDFIDDDDEFDDYEMSNSDCSNDFPDFKEEGETKTRKQKRGRGRPPKSDTLDKKMDVKNEQNDDFEQGSLGVFGVISHSDFDLFKLNLPDGALPDLPKDILDELRCHECYVELNSWKEKLKHQISVHLGVSAYKCPMDQVTLNLDNWEDHLRSVHNITDNFQSFSFFDKSLMQHNHEFHLSPSSPFFVSDNQCGLCGLVCNDRLAFSYHRKYDHNRHGTIPIYCPFCVTKTTTNHQENNVIDDTQTYEVDRAKILNYNQLRSHVLRGHLGYEHKRLPDMPNDVDPMSGRIVIRYGNTAKKLEDLFFPEYHDTLFYPEKTLEKLKEGDGTLEQFPNELKNLLVICLKSIKQIPDKVKTLEERIRLDVIKLKCSIPNTKMYPKDTICFECGEEFESCFKRMSHFLESHNPQRNFYLQCYICGENLEPGKKESLRHMKLYHKKAFDKMSGSDSWKLNKPDEEGKIITVTSEKGTQFQCDRCSLLCGSELSYWFHLKSDHNYTMLSNFIEQSCKACAITRFDSEWSFFNHLMNKHGGFQYKCPVCSKGYNKNFMYNDHFKVHATTGVKEIRHGSLQKLSGKKSGLYQTESCICDICSKELKSIRMLAQHKSNFHGIEVPCSCRVPKCGIEFNSFKEESKHFREVHQKFQTTCHICGKMLLGKGLLQKHIEADHSGQVQKVVCQICSKQLKSVQNLKNHMKLHDASHKGHECSYCGKNFKWTTSLNSHIKAAHSVVYKSFECKECGKIFKDPANFKAHSYTHSSVKPYNCTKCGKGFVRRDTWLTHNSACTVVPNTNLPNTTVPLR